MPPQPPMGVLLMSFGTAAAEGDVPAYLASVRGRPAPPEMVDEFQRRFRVIGGSPLTRITLEQAAALESLLNGPNANAPGYRVAAGMLHAPPLVADALSGLARAGARRVLAIILAPQNTPMVQAAYYRALEAARAALPGAIDLRAAGAWHRTPAFLDALAMRIEEGLERLAPDERGSVPVLFTAHSLPRHVAGQDPAYVQMLMETAGTTAERLGLAPHRWRLAYQSAGRAPGEWLGPDIKEVLAALGGQGARKALVAPVQFVADHLEVLYDIDIEAAEAARRAGLAIVRTEAFNTMPRFIQALADVVRREVDV